MVIYENDCVGCPDSIGCIGKTCPKVNVPHYYCDECGDETDTYIFDNAELCSACILNKFKKTIDY